MRKIKIRVWDKAQQQMNYSGTIGSGSSVDLLTLDFDGNIRVQNLYGLDMGTRNPAFDQPEGDFIPMLGSHLVDKNKK